MFGAPARRELPLLAPAHVVTKATAEEALAAQHFTVQVVAFDVADQLAVEVDLVQVPAAVIQVVEGAAIRQGQGAEVVERVIVVTQGALRPGFFDQAAQPIVAEAQDFRLHTHAFALLAGLTRDAQQAIGVIVVVVVTRLGGDLAEQAAGRVAFEVRAALRALAAVVVAGFGEAEQVFARMVGQVEGFSRLQTGVVTLDLGDAGIAAQGVQAGLGEGLAGDVALCSGRDSQFFLSLESFAL